jgi:hypothetical protein
MEITDAQIAAARKRGEEVGPCAVAARYVEASGRLEVEFDNGVMIAVPTPLLQGLANATPADMQTIEITPGGWGLHFPAIDADVYAPSFFTGIYGSKIWMQQLGAKGGAARTEAKAAASRENGKKGGRPRKDAQPVKTTDIFPNIKNICRTT